MIIAGVHVDRDLVIFLAGLILGLVAGGGGYHGYHRYTRRYYPERYRRW